MKTFRTATMWPLIAIALFFAFILACKKDFSVPIEIAESIDWKVSQEQFDNSKEGLKGEAAAHFFDFNFAVQNNPNVVAAATGRDENEDALHALCVELIAQNQEYNFASALISQVGYPMWSRAMFYTNSSQTDAPAVILPFAQLNDDSTRAFIYATPIDNDWYIRLFTRKQVDSLLTNAPNADNLRFKVGMLGMFDKQVFDNPTLRYADFVLGEGLATPAGDRCTWVITITYICARLITFTDHGPAGDREECKAVYYVDCYTGGGIGGGNGNSWFNDGGGLGQGNGEGGYGGSIYSSFSDLNGGASVAFSSLWQAYLGTLEPDGGSQQGSSLTASEIALFEQLNTLNNLGLFSLGQLEMFFNNPLFIPDAIAFLSAHPGDPLAQDALLSICNITDHGWLNGPYPEYQRDAIIEQYNFPDPAMYVEYALNCVFLKQQHPGWSDFRIAAEAYLMTISGYVHTTFDILGLFPGFGEPFDLTNGVLYVVEGDGVNAGLSFAATIPIAGWVATGSKYANVAVRILGTETVQLLKFTHVGNGIITFGARSDLRKVMNITDAANDAHHIIPWGNQGHPLVQQAAKADDVPYHMNHPKNGKEVQRLRFDQPDGIHANHPQYDTRVQAKMETAWNVLIGDYGGAANIPASVASQKLRDIQDEISAIIDANPGVKINDIIF
ncbi:MAG: AHH domain-containing protein [Saprospiraceae bacterium]